jgi:hypothetical protein
MLLQITGTDIMTLLKEVEDISYYNVSIVLLLLSCLVSVWSLFTHSFGFFVIFDFGFFLCASVCVALKQMCNFYKKCSLV